MWLIYTPALLVRQRAVDSKRLTRFLSCMALMQAHSGIKKYFFFFYDRSFINDININHL